ncbi:hypothetical protein CEXT_587931 [Caerostris extrusa]|uniref:Uncharacterized protein n=1 Tax=Caerostris extrusa TaxID=172846 RepID=A0AAV4NPB0_CAEEX|nr:hypothetical protein CEXT_587931 [Caerostris extrusa]
MNQLQKPEGEGKGPPTFYDVYARDKKSVDCRSVDFDVESGRCKAAKYRPGGVSLTRTEVDKGHDDIYVYFTTHLPPGDAHLVGISLCSVAYMFPLGVH